MVPGLQGGCFWHYLEGPLVSLTKRHLTERVCDNCGFRMRQSTAAVETLLELMKSVLESGEDVLISGFGKFCVR